jgi:hypothetical protein
MHPNAMETERTEVSNSTVGEEVDGSANVNSTLSPDMVFGDAQIIRDQCFKAFRVVTGASETVFTTLHFLRNL